MKISNAILGCMLACSVSVISLAGCSAAPDTNPDPEQSQTDSSATTSTKVSSKEAAKAPESDSDTEYVATWEGEAPSSFGRSGANATVGNVAIAQSSSGNYLLKIDFVYTNESDTAMNFINCTYCNVAAYQSGIELDDPGITSEKGVYDYSSAFKSIKNGGTIETQLVWTLDDVTNPVELDFGLDEKYKPMIISTLKISKA